VGFVFLSVRLWSKMSDQAGYETLETPALVNVLKNPGSTPEIHMSALAALSQRGESHRIPGLTEVLQHTMQHPGQYDPQVLAKIVQMLAAEPGIESTRGLLGVLPDVLRLVLGSGGGLKPEFREMYYQTLVTRDSDEDLAAWGEVLPGLDGRALAAAVVDPAAGPLAAIDPWTLLERLEEPERTRALITVIIGWVGGLGSPEDVKRVVPMLRESSDPAQLEEGLELLGQYWQQAKKAGREALVNNLEAVLRVLDRRPRTTSERMTGKRPWAD
jgi:hypothetical protein